MSRPVAVKLPIVLPWYAFCVETMWTRFVDRRAIFSAASTASVPLFEKKLIWRSPGAMFASSLASEPICSLKNTRVDSDMRSSCFLTAATTFG